MNIEDIELLITRANELISSQDKLINNQHEIIRT